MLSIFSYADACRSLSTLIYLTCGVRFITLLYPDVYKRQVHYSFQGVGTNAGTLEITPVYNGTAQASAARKTVFTSENQLGTIDGFFAFTADNGGTELSFNFDYLPEAALVDSKFSVMIERKS